MKAKWDILPPVGGLRNSLPSSSAKAGFHSHVFSFLMIDHREQDQFEANTSDFRILVCGNNDKLYIWSFASITQVNKRYKNLKKSSRLKGILQYDPFTVFKRQGSFSFVWVFLLKFFLIYSIQLVYSRYSINMEDIRLSKGIEIIIPHCLLGVNST